MITRSRLYRLISDYRTRARWRRWTPQDQAMLRFYSGFIAPGDLCFDVGANVGNRTNVFLRLGARVVAVEPQSTCASILAERFESEKDLFLVRKALAATVGRAEIRTSSASTISSMSDDWIHAVQASGRFAQYAWDGCESVDTTTLDLLIAERGVPSFIKIDVEGFEEQVVRGLSQPVRALSFEFTPELMDRTFACLDHLQSLGQIQANFSLEERMDFGLPNWTDISEFRRVLGSIDGRSETFGDVYVRFPEVS